MKEFTEESTSATLLCREVALGSYLTSSGLGFFFSKMGIIIVFNSKDSCENCMKLTLRKGKVSSYYYN